MYEHAYPTKIPVCSVNDRFPYTKRNIIQVNGARQVVIIAVLDKVWTSGEDMIRQIAAATGQSDQMLRAFNRRRLNTPPDSLPDSRNQDVDEVIADHIQPQEKERRRLNDERLRAMMADLKRKWFG